MLESALPRNESWGRSPIYHLQKEEIKHYKWGALYLCNFSRSLVGISNEPLSRKGRALVFQALSKRAVGVCRAMWERGQAVA